MPNDTFIIVIPPNAGGGAYATAINDAIAEIRTKLTPKVPTSALNIDADLDCENHRVSDVKSLVLTAQSSETTPFSHYARGVDHYVRDGAGNEIRLTASGVLNAGVTDLNGAHGTRFKQILPALLGINTGTPINYTNGRGVGSAAGAAVFYCALPELRRGDRILSVIGTFGTGVGVGTSAITLKRCIGDNIAPATVGTASSGSTGQPITVTISALTETVASGVSYVLEVATGRAQDSFSCITVEYDHP